MSSSTFVIIGEHDNPLYELVWSQKKEEPSVNQQNQFHLHAALDIVDEEIWKNASLYGAYTSLSPRRGVGVSFLTANDDSPAGTSRLLTSSTTGASQHAKFLLLHEGKSEDSVRSFFNEVHELYLKTLLNPFQDQSAPITSQAFDSKVRAAARKFL